ncbi:MAG: ribonuclease E inhibitor RraB [Planctomycetota bacterium]
MHQRADWTVDDRGGAIQSVDRGGENPDAPRRIWHYLYLPTREDAAQIAAELRHRGFRTEERLGADGLNWLVLASHEGVLTEDAMAAARCSMEALVARVGGEYDGWEAEAHDGRQS